MAYVFGVIATQMAVDEEGLQNWRMITLTLLIILFIIIIIMIRTRSIGDGKGVQEVERSPAQL